MTLLVLDDRRFAAGAYDAPAGTEPIAFTAFARRFGIRVLDAAAHRALIRRIARRPEAGVPAHLRGARSFADRAVAALASGDPALPNAFRDVYALTLGRAELVDCAGFWAASRTAHEPLSAVAIDGALIDSEPAWLREVCRSEVVVVDGSPQLRADAPRDVAALASLFTYLDRGSDADLRAFALSPLSPLVAADGRALAVAASRDGTFADILVSGKVVLSVAGREAVHVLREGLAAVERAHRAPDATAASTFAAIAIAFGLPAKTTARTLAAIAAACEAFDRARAIDGGDWRAAEVAFELTSAIATAEARLAPAAVEPLSPLPALPAQPVDARRTSFSASSLNTYVECQRKWYYRYVCSAVEDPGSTASTYGRAFHSALEEFHKLYPRPGDQPETQLAAVLRGYINAAFDRYRGGLGSNVEFELQRRRAQRTAAQYVRHVAERARREPFTVIGCELEVGVELGGYRFVGYIDRVDREDRSGGVAIVDYKTGSIATSAADYRAQVLSFADFQLPFYYWSQTANGERVTRLALVPLKEGHLDVRPVELEVVPVPVVESKRNGTISTISIGELERARAKMIEICAAIASGTIAHFPATDDAQACRYCVYSDGCREQPALTEARFGR